MINIVCAFLIFLGIFFVFVGSLGVLRFNDVYLRLQASSKALTFGFVFVVMGTAMLAGDPLTIGKAVIAVIFQILTAPVAAQVIARAALRRGIDPLEQSAETRRATRA